LTQLGRKPQRNPALQRALTRPALGRVGKQKIKDTGPLNAKRMETVEDDLLERSLHFIDRSHKAGKLFFPVAQLHALPCVDASIRQVEEQDRLRALCRRDGFFDR
jgi:hypothetical protein